MLSLFESITLESLGDFRITLALSDAAHSQIHTDLGALAVEVLAQTFYYVSFDAFDVAYYVLASVFLFAFFYFHEFRSACFAYGALSRSFVSHNCVTADCTYKFLH